MPTVWSRFINRNFRNGIIELKCFFPLSTTDDIEKKCCRRKKELRASDKAIMSTHAVSWQGTLKLSNFAFKVIQLVCHWEKQGFFHDFE